MSKNQMNSYEKIRELIKDVEGYLSFQEAVFLYNTAKNVKNGVIVEIGAYKGLSTICLGLGSKERNKVKVFSVDPHKWDNTKEDFLKNIKKYKVDDVVIPVYKKSCEFVNEFKRSISFLFIDGDHRKNAVENDFIYWFPKVEEGGIMSIHDVTNFPGPKEIAIQYICKTKNFSNVGLVDSLIYGQKSRKGKLHLNLVDIIESKYQKYKLMNSVFLDKKKVKLKDNKLIILPEKRIFKLTSEQLQIIKLFDGQHTFYEIVEKLSLPFPVIKNLFDTLHKSKVAFYNYECRK